MKKKQVAFTINTFEQAKNIIAEAKIYKIIPILHFKNYILKGFGSEFIIRFRLQKSTRNRLESLRKLLQIIWLREYFSWKYPLARRRSSSLLLHKALVKSLSENIIFKENFFVFLNI